MTTNTPLAHPPFGSGCSDEDFLLLDSDAKGSKQHEHDNDSSELAQQQPLPPALLLDPLLYADDDDDDVYEDCAAATESPTTHIPLHRWMSSPLSGSINTSEGGHSSFGVGERISALDSSGGDGRSSVGTNSQQSELFPLLHSDFTIPTSNLRRRTSEENSHRSNTNNDPTAIYSSAYENDSSLTTTFPLNAPPTDVLLQNCTNTTHNGEHRRSIFPTYYASQRLPYNNNNNNTYGSTTTNNATTTTKNNHHHYVQQQSQSLPNTHYNHDSYTGTTNDMTRNTVATTRTSTTATATTTAVTKPAAAATANTTTSILWSKLQQQPINDDDNDDHYGHHHHNHLYHTNNDNHCDPDIPFYALQLNGILSPQPTTTTTTRTATTSHQLPTNIHHHQNNYYHHPLQQYRNDDTLSSSMQQPPIVQQQQQQQQKQQTNNSPQRTSQTIWKETSNTQTGSTATAGVDAASLLPSHPPHSPKHYVHSPSHNNHHHHHHHHTCCVVPPNQKRETRHAQSLLLGCAFAGLWSSSNLTAPNLTEMAAAFFGSNDNMNDNMNDTIISSSNHNHHHHHYTTTTTSEGDRDWYMGSLLALVVSVGSIPTAAILGILADIVPSRKHLFCTVLWGGAISCGLTAYCTTYAQLVACRWFNGGCLAGSVPVAFSLLADWFDVSERNVASSGLTALMGLGIIAGQVYAGGGLFVAHKPPWSQAFVVTAILQVVLTLLCMYVIRDPVRGGREKVLQDMLSEGRTYERKLTVRSLIQAVFHNSPSNTLLLWQGLFSSIPWGVTFVFLNDFLSQERGFSVPDATYLVAIFGMGCAAGGVLGGYVGQVLQERSDRRFLLPLFMAVTTGAGILPFYALLNSNFSHAHSIPGVLCATLGGLVASLPAVNVRPCLLNVNFPESRGVSLTTANLLIQLGRGIGPTCLTLIQSTLHVNRTYAFNVTLIVFWTISAFQLLLLMKTLPRDQDAMEAELALYAAHAISAARTTALAPKNDGHDVDDEKSIVTIEERMTSFDDIAAKETLVYVRAGIQELRSPLFHCTTTTESSCESDDDNDNNEAPVQNNGSSAAVEETTTPVELGRDVWTYGPEDDAVDDSQHYNNKWTDETLLLPQPQSAEHLPTETTPLIV